MVRYDPGILRQFSEKLYSRANVVLVTTTMISTLIACAIGFPLGQFVESAFHAQKVVGTIVMMTGVLGLGVGAIIGSQRAFMLRMTAQQVLCQVKIELNTRKIARAKESVAEDETPPSGIEKE